MIYQFDYDVYFRQNCVVPICLMLFSGLLLVLLILSVCRHKKTFLLRDWIGSLLTAAIMAVLMTINVVPLIRGGFCLLWEKESAQVQITGTVEETVEIPFMTGQKYDVKNNNGSGEAIIVDGQKYYLTGYFDVRPGDRVSLYVLPQSGFVLQMEVVRDNRGDIGDYGGGRELPFCLSETHRRSGFV